MTASATTDTKTAVPNRGPFLVSTWSDRTPQPGDRRTLTRARFVTPKDEYGLARRCSPVADHFYDGGDGGGGGGDVVVESTTIEPDWSCQHPPVLWIEQVHEEWQGRAAAGAWVPSRRAAAGVTLCERHARSFLGDAKYDALPWPGGQVTFTPAPAPKPTTKGTRHDRTR